MRLSKSKYFVLTGLVGLIGLLAVSTPAQAVSLTRPMQVQPLVSLGPDDNNLSMTLLLVQAQLEQQTLMRLIPPLENQSWLNRSPIEPFRPLLELGY